jgi:hypothetical protein
VEFAGRKRFFFEKKKQKTFIYSGCLPGRRRNPQQTRVFLLLFLQKKEALSSILNRTPDQPSRKVRAKSASISVQPRSAAA